ncbi:MAG: hypothetical protein PF569_03865 [Candidatus Woesearchaeota archaeon]|jgi:hypothetical protein|nr:hypothetical protein [Candidatus Woesearchaeota archaeon]
MKKLVLGDIHYRELISGGREMPYQLGIIKFFEWFCNSDYNNDSYDSLLLIGDLTEKSMNQGAINDFFLNLFQHRIKIPLIEILEGNHDKNRKGSNNHTFLSLSNVKIISHWKVNKEENCNMLYLPYFYGKEMKSTYENLDIHTPIDFCFAHIMDETRDFGGHKGIDLSYLNINQRVFGHDHNFNLDKGGSYLGSISPNSYTERDQKKYMYVIDTDTKESEAIEIPVYVGYKEVTYPDNLAESNYKYTIWTVKEALDKKQAIDYYKSQDEDFYYRRIERKKTQKEIDIEENRGDNDNISLSEYFKLYRKQSGLSDKVSDIVETILKE